MFYFIMFKLFSLTIKEIENIQDFNSLTQKERIGLQQCSHVFANVRVSFEKSIFSSDLFPNLKEQAINYTKELNLDEFNLIKDGFVSKNNLSNLTKNNKIELVKNIFQKIDNTIVNIEMNNCRLKSKITKTTKGLIYIVELWAILNFL